MKKCSEAGESPMTEAKAHKLGFLKKSVKKAESLGKSSKVGRMK